MKPFERSARVAGQVQKILSGMLQKNIKDPRLAAVTITGVKMTRDLRIARIYYTTHGGQEASRGAQEGFQSARGYVKRTLAARLGLRYMPDLTFHLDGSFDRGARVEKLLKAIETENESPYSSFDR